MFWSFLSKKAIDKILNINVGDGATVSDVIKEIPSSVAKLGKETAKDIQETIQSYKETAERRAESATKAFKSDISTTQKITRGAVEIGTGFFDVVGDTLIGAGKVLLPQKAEDAISTGISNLLSPVAKSKVVQNAIQWYQEQPEATQETIKTGVLTLGLVSDLFTGGRSSQITRQLAKAGEKEVYEILLKNGFDEQVSRKIAKRVDKATKPKDVDKIIKDELATYIDLPETHKITLNYKTEDEFAKKIDKIYNELKNIKEPELPSIKLGQTKDIKITTDIADKVVQELINRKTIKADEAVSVKYIIQNFTPDEAKHLWTATRQYLKAYDIRPVDKNKAIIQVKGQNFTLLPSDAVKENIRKQAIQKLKDEVKLELQNKKLLKDQEKARRQIEKMLLEFKINQEKELNKLLTLPTKFSTNRSKEKDFYKAVVEPIKNFGLDARKITLEDGTPITDVIRVKRTQDGTLQAVVRKSQIKSIKDTINPKYLEEPENNLIKSAFNQIVGGYTLPAIMFARMGKGLYEHVYKPVRIAERASAIEKEKMLRKLGKFYKPANVLSNGKINLTKRQAKRIFRYYAYRQGKDISKPNLTKEEKEFIKVFDSLLKEYEEKFYQVARKNGKYPRKIENYAPLYSKREFKYGAVSDMDYIMRNHPAFASLKERKDVKSIDAYEQDYRKVVEAYINGMSRFIHLGDTTPEIKYLINSKEFKEIVPEEIHERIRLWLKNITTGEKITAVKGISRILRKTMALSKLGLSPFTAMKQPLSNMAAYIIDGYPTKFKSKYAKELGIKISELPSVLERRGDITIKDMDSVISKALLGHISATDKACFVGLLNGMFDTEVKKILTKRGIKAKDLDKEIIDKILWDIQETADMWFSSMSKSNIPEFFRTEHGKMWNIFIHPLTAQLNGYIYRILQAKGFNGNISAVSKVLAAAIAVAYYEQVVSNMSFKWSDKEQMRKDIGVALLMNFPIISQIVSSFNYEKDLGLPILSNASNLLKKLKQYSDGYVQADDVLFAGITAFGVPDQIINIIEGAEIYKEGGIRDRNGKMLVPITDRDEIIRSFLKGKFGSLYAKDWVRNVGVKRDKRAWYFPEVEFLQNGDWRRRIEIANEIGWAKADELAQFLSDANYKKYKKYKNIYLATGRLPKGADKGEEELKKELEQKLINGEITLEEAKKIIDNYRAYGRR